LLQTASLARQSAENNRRANASQGCHVSRPYVVDVRFFGGNICGHRRDGCGIIGQRVSNRPSSQPWTAQRQTIRRQIIRP
jgi:hypothetical protein